MKAAVLHAKGDLRYEDYPDPSFNGGEVLVKVRAAGICGSDIPRVNSGTAHYFPIVLGHEFSGEVIGIGDGVTSLKIGDRVSCAPLLPCMTCEDCQKGDYALCKNYSFIGSREQGGFADLVKMPERNAIKFENHVSFEQGAFFEPAAVALHGLRCIDYRGGEDVAILGGGTIGIFTAQWSRILGARRVVVFDVVEERLELAKKLGADVTINTVEKDFKERAMAMTGNKGFRFIYETAGVDATEKLAFELAGNKSSICFIGTPTREITFTPRLFENMNRKEFLLTGSWMSYSAPFPGREWSDAAYYFSTGELRFDESLIYKRLPMARAAEGFDMYHTPGLVKGKILLTNE